MVRCKICKSSGKPGEIFLVESFEECLENAICSNCIQPERSKREDLIEMVVPPELEFLTKERLRQDIQFVKSCCGINHDLLGSGALNTMET